MTMPHDPNEPTRLTPRRAKPRDDDDQAADRAAVSRLDTAKPGAGELEADPGIRPIYAPARVSVILECPTCGETSTVVASLFARVTKDSDGKGALALRTRAAKVEHVCGQMPLGLVEGPRSR